ncbi:MAG: hypothetical protein ACPG4X_21595 [Pikeienuella sp.]
MARTIKVKLGGKERTLKASFAAAEAICENVADLMLMNRESMAYAMFIAKGLPYTPKWAFSVKSIVSVIAIGSEHSGHDIDSDVIEADVIGMGVDKAQDVATSYLQLFFAQPDTEPETGADTSAEGK